jgi:hypothetical protein
MVSPTVTDRDADCYAQAAIARWRALARRRGFDASLIAACHVAFAPHR